jgi:membrane-associated protease RseP (regulator of RpoE activity)
MTNPSDVSDSPWPAPERDSGVSSLIAGGATGEQRPTSTRQMVGGGLTLLAMFVVLGIANGWWLLFTLGLLVSIVLHEVGHYATARFTGMRVTQFFIGFGPRVGSIVRSGTEFGVRALPLGAFVRIVGMTASDDADVVDESTTYRSKSFGARLLVITAGSLMHLLLAVVVLSSVFAVRGENVVMPGAQVVGVGAGMPAEGVLLDGDVIRSVSGREVGDDGLGAVIRSFQPGDTVSIEGLREGIDFAAGVTLGSDLLIGGNGDVAFLGVSTTVPFDVVQHSWWTSPVHASREIVTQIGVSAAGVVQVLNPSNVLSHLTASDVDPLTRPTTLIGVTAVSDDIGRSAGIWGVLELLAFVGVFNMFPLLPLDGGHAAIAIYERLRERRGGPRYHADVTRLVPLTMAVVALLAFMFMSGLYLDIVNPIR